MPELVKLFQDLRFPALRKGSHDKHLIGFFVLVHLWKLADDADRRTFWAAVCANKEFDEGFASKGRAHGVRGIRDREGPEITRHDGYICIPDARPREHDEASVNALIP